MNIEQFQVNMRLLCAGNGCQSHIDCGWEYSQTTEGLHQVQQLAHAAERMGWAWVRSNHGSAWRCPICIAEMKAATR